MLNEGVGGLGHGICVVKGVGSWVELHLAFATLGGLDVCAALAATAAIVPLLITCLLLCASCGVAAGCRRSRGR